MRHVWRFIVCWGLLAWPTLASAQSIGTFRWQQQPYCNVLTLSVTPKGDAFVLDGYDDGCGAARRSSAVGVAFLNPDGTVGMGLTIVTADGSPVHLDSVLSLSTVSGAWRDNTGQTGPWAFTPGASIGGSPRPSPRSVFPAGLSAAGAPITDVAVPTGPSDATPKSYVDSANAATLASAVTFARSLNTASIPLTAYSAISPNTPPAITDAGGCLYFAPDQNGGLFMGLPAPTGAVIQSLRLKYLDNSPQTMTFDVYGTNFNENVTFHTDTHVGTLSSTNGNPNFRVETMTFTGLAPVSGTRSYYLQVYLPPHVVGTLLEFCGAELIYSLP